MKRLSVWALAGMTTAIIGIVVVVRHQSDAAAEYKRDRRKWCDNAVFSSAQQASCPNEGPDSEDYLPWWYKLVAWPQGVATWAIIATGGLIGWQAWETRRAAEASRDSAAIANRALISQFRPKIQLRTIRLIEADDSLTLEVIVANKGESEGTICKGFVDITWEWPHKQEPSHESTTTYETFTLQPGEDAPLGVNMRDGWVLYRWSVGDFSEGRQTLALRCSGEIHYTDGNGIKRRTAFWRVLDHSSGRFMPDPTPEREYQD